MPLTALLVSGRVLRDGAVAEGFVAGILIRIGTLGTNLIFGAAWGRVLSSNGIR